MIEENIINQMYNACGHNSCMLMNRTVYDISNNE